MAREVTFTNDDVTLAGSLAVPDRGATAGVVMVGGSGPSDRDNDTYFPPLRRHLVAAGIAVLSYDKRGVGASSGDWRAATMADLAADAAAALDFLRTRPEVRPDTVGLFGHSEGGWVVLRAAAGRDDVPWVITNSCPATTPAVQERHALANALGRGGATARDLAAALTAYDTLVEAGRRDSDFAHARRLVDAVGNAPFADHYWSQVDEALWEFLKRKQDHDPLPDVLRLRCPHLAIFGGADALVPVADSVHLFGAAACHPDRHPSATTSVELFPGADHRLHTEAGTRLATGYLETLTRWIERFSGVRATSSR
ncbi:alpha/beta hydrolase family protein [Actinophytocola sp.]|uniref:alpha/beta hydrolase family protein n=1 Tax=Actinophytocola sp. TaxID=1872138 RepID=UPI00389A0FBC